MSYIAVNKVEGDLEEVTNLSRDSKSSPHSRRGRNKTAAILSLLVLLAFPITSPFLTGPASLHLVVLAYIGTGGLLLVAYSQYVRFSQHSWPLWAPLLLAVAYIGMHLTISTFFGVTGSNFQDLNEVARVIGIIIFFLLGVLIGETITPNAVKTVLVVLGLLLTYLLMAWVAEPLRTPLFDLYITRGGRFSGLGFGVNYVWAHSLVLFGLLLYLWASDKKAGVFLGGWLVLIIVANALLSGSRTSLLVLLLPVLYLLFAFGSQKLLRGLLVGLIVLGGIFMASEFAGFALFDGHFDRTLSRIDEVVAGYQARDMRYIPALDVRFEEFYDRMKVISEKPIVGHGLNRGVEPFFHNSFQRTAYRYGVLGLLIELLIYLLALPVLFRIARRQRMAAVAAAFILAYLPAGSVSLVWYELRVPYLLSALLGVATVSYSVDLRNKKCMNRRQTLPSDE